jgi:hypothetical protein
MVVFPLSILTLLDKKTLYFIGFRRTSEVLSWNYIFEYQLEVDSDVPLFHSVLDKENSVNVFISNGMEIS